MDGFRLKPLVLHMYNNWTCSSVLADRQAGKLFLIASVKQGREQGKRILKFHKYQQFI